MQVLVVKQLTFSDSSYEVSKTGRVVLPRSQVEACLPELLRRGGAGHALAAVKSSTPLRLAVDLGVVDQHGESWGVALKTWQNVVSGQHRPTFVLENTASFMHAHGMRQGSVLAVCVEAGRLQLRSDVPMPSTPGGAAKVTGRAAPAQARTPPKRRSAGPAPACITPKRAKEVDVADVDVQAAHVLVSMLRSDSCSTGTPCLSPTPSTGAAADADPGRSSVAETAAFSQEGSTESVECSAGAPAPPPPMPPLFQQTLLPSSPLPLALAMAALPQSAFWAAEAAEAAARYIGAGGGHTAVAAGFHSPRAGTSIAQAGYPPTPALTCSGLRPPSWDTTPSMQRGGSLNSDRTDTGTHIVLSAPQLPLRAAHTSPPVTIARAPPSACVVRAASGPVSTSFFSHAIALEALRSSSLPAPL